MAPVGHTPRHVPQPMHVSVSMRARLFSTVIEEVGQVFAHFWQPMQPTLHTLRVLAPAMVFLHVTTEAVGDEAWSTIEMMPRGHIFAHVPQPVQAAVSMRATPFSTTTASNGHASAQSP